MVEIFLFFLAVVFSLCVSACVIVFLLSLLLVLLQLIYQLPYLVWVGWTGKSTSFPSAKERPFFSDTIYATKLYIHWIFHKELDF